MMKHLIGVCCAMLLCLSACNDIDSPKFPPARVEVNEIKSLSDLSFSELRNLENEYGISIDYRSTRMFMLSGNVILDSHSQSYTNVEYFISRVKDYLSENNLLQYNIDYEKVYSIQPDYWNGKLTSFWNMEWPNWGIGTYYYRMVAYNWNGGDGPGILDDCLSQDGKQATFSEIKSFTVSTKYLPYADYSYSDVEGMMYAYFNLNDFEEEITRIGVCYTQENRLPTTADQTYTADAVEGVMSFPISFQSNIYYMRPFVVTKDNVTTYGYVKEFHISTLK